MPRRIPVMPTLLVLVAVAAMITLGVWQLHRLKWKEALLARYDSAVTDTAEVPWPTNAAQAEERLYRRSRLECTGASDASSVAGRNAHGESGFAHVVQCALAGGGSARVVLGWSRQPAAPDWRGGAVTGMIAPGPRLVADPPLDGLAANAKPDPADIPNNHLSYAVQWFFFAAVAVAIYGLALKKRWLEE